jgi:hypothetical protein
MPTGQVFRWHLRIMMQPSATSGMVEKPNSSAPSSAAMARRGRFAACRRSARDAAAQIVHHQNLLRFRQAQFPGRARVLERSQRRSARAAVVSADQHHVGMRLRDARRDRAHTHFGDQLDRNARLAD